jgi:hypothetical protein
MTRIEAMSHIRSRLTPRDRFGHEYESVVNYIHKLNEMSDDEVIKEAYSIDPALSAPPVHENETTTKQQNT